MDSNPVYNSTKDTGSRRVSVQYNAAALICSWCSTEFVSELLPHLPKKTAKEKQSLNSEVCSYNSVRYLKFGICYVKIWHTAAVGR
jgi:hypothetical protein